MWIATTDRASIFTFVLPSPDSSSNNSSYRDVLHPNRANVSKDELRALVEKSYSTFRHPDITPLKKLTETTYILELFHGPTFAFKDVALQLLGNLFEFFLKRRNARKSSDEKPEKLTVVGATSGDTGR